MKKLIAFVMILVLALCALGMGHAAKVNENRYYAEAFCRQEGSKLIFDFCGNSFVWHLGAGDKIPENQMVLLVMDNNGTVGQLEDDFIVSYR